MGTSFSLTNKTRGKTPRVPFRLIKEKVLGKSYDLSVALIVPASMRAITRKTKNKDKISNVLAFPLSKTSGEILLCKSAAAPYTLDYLFIHGLLHLKGMRHGATMEHEERRIMKKFGLRIRE